MARFPRLDTLTEDERLCLYCSLIVQRLIDNKTVKAQADPIPTARSRDYIERSLRDYPHLFEFGPHHVEFGVEVVGHRYGVTPNTEIALHG